MNFYLVPMTQQTLANNQTATAPEYLTTDLKGLAWTALSFGVEGLAIVSLASANAALAAETDVFSIPADLTTILADSDVTNLAAYCDTYNVPESWITAGMTWSAVLRQIAQIFLAAQFCAGQNGGTSLFAAVTTMHGALPQPPSQAIASLQSGVFDTSSVDPTASVGDTLIALSSQFTAPIYIGVGTLAAPVSPVPDPITPAPISPAQPAPVVKVAL